MDINEDITILYVEDDEIDIMSLKRCFQENSLKNRMFVAESGEEGLEFLRSNIVKKPCVIILDVHLPKMSGIEMLKSLRLDDDIRDTPVFMLTTSDREKDILDAYDLDVSDYLVKPIDIEDLKEKMSKLTL